MEDAKQALRLNFVMPIKNNDKTGDDEYGSRSKGESVVSAGI